MLKSYVLIQQPAVPIGQALIQSITLEGDYSGLTYQSALLKKNINDTDGAAILTISKTVISSSQIDYKITSAQAALLQGQYYLFIRYTDSAGDMHLPLIVGLFWGEEKSGL